MGQFIAERVLASPVTVFAGLGTAVGVLIDSVQRIRSMLPTKTPHVFQVDPGDRATSPFSTALQIRDEEYIRSGWVAFMEQLSQRLAREHCVAFSNAANVLMAEEEWRRLALIICAVVFSSLGSWGSGACALVGPWMTTRCFRNGGLSPHGSPNCFLELL